MVSRFRSPILGFALGLAWLLLAREAVAASARPTYREFQLGLAPTIEWPRVVVVCGLLAAELLAFHALLRVVASAPSRAERMWWIAGGTAASIGLSFTVRSHGPEELNLPGRVGLLLLVLGLALGMASGLRAALGRRHAGTG